MCEAGTAESVFPKLNCLFLILDFPPYPAKAPEHPLLRMENGGQALTRAAQTPPCGPPGIRDSLVPSMGSADSPRMPTSDPSVMRGEPGWGQWLAVHFCPLPVVLTGRRGAGRRAAAQTVPSHTLPTTLVSSLPRSTSIHYAPSGPTSYPGASSWFQKLGAGRDTLAL